MNHLMIDLETLGTRFDCPVVAIGAAVFNPETGEIGKTFYRSIDFADACRFGKPSGDTIKWWLQQDAQARKDVIKGESNLADALAEFVAFYESVGPKTPVWGNGSTFDISILDYAIQRCLARTSPWPFYAVRDCRTIKHLAESAGFEQTVTQGGTAHNALDDAIYQAKWVSEMWRALAWVAKPAMQSSLAEDLLS